MSSLDLALVHHPVKNRHGDVIAATSQEFDLMDAARLALTYDVRRLYIVQTIPAQRAMIERLIAHGRASDRDVAARGSFERTVLVSSIQEAITHASTRTGKTPQVWSTSAQPRGDVLSWSSARERLAGGVSALVLIGKAWGLAPTVFEDADICLAAIDPGTGFNHLSVRAAMAIIVDRLLGADDRAS